jgi:hypothetical protein
MEEASIDSKVEEMMNECKDRYPTFSLPLIPVVCGLLCLGPN